ncbi:MAG: hypothetical protein Q7R66_15005 [Undibacterium sp.]|uniref:hypothetical protein n=1 Tax=Undibacterium sp. TaxID=1914977 RepID=UPI002723DDD6|nr:hypothetical protein [Undibacterium sp.]MDO8653492.1 hypothetical protein [Undibacterium sp.]
MTRTQNKAPHLTKEIGKRFIQTLVENLGLSLTEASKVLGYKNATTLRAIKNETSLPSIEKLLMAASKLHDAYGLELDLHWVLTGRRQAFFEEPVTSKRISSFDNDIIILVKKLSPKKKKALISFLEVN